MYAKLFIENWQSVNPGWQFFGIGDREMGEQGMDCQGFAEDLAVVGLQEVLTHYTEIKKTFYDILGEVERRRPRFALLLDYPGFNLRLAAQLKKLNIPVVYYISPQLWAWKKGRVRQIRKFVDDMLVVFPFEVDFYQKYQIKARFVGHPLVEVVAGERRGFAPTEAATQTLGLMPGSRKSEIKYNLQTQLEAARILRLRQPNIKVKLLLAPTLATVWVRDQIGPQFDFVEIAHGKPTAMIMSCDYILAASGTATLQVALCKKPMVVMYRMNSLTAVVARLLVKSVDFFCIVNLIAGKALVPEFFQEQATGQNLANELVKIMQEPSVRGQMLAEFDNIIDKLGSGGATKNVVNYLTQRYVGT